ncbi:MAG: Gfo/Idh/MocA family protein [Chthoniobacteraceae bacterium]
MKLCTKMDICNIGVIGTGWIANLEHGPALQNYVRGNPRFHLKAACDIKPNQAESFAERFGFERHYQDVATMLDTEDLQAVYVMVPDRFTASIAELPLRRGMATLIEKPPATTPEELSRLIQIADETGAPNFVAFNRRCMPLINRMQSRIAEIVLQEHVVPELISCRFARYGRFDQDFSTTAIHAIDTISYICRSPYKSLQIDYWKQGAAYRHDNILMRGQMVSDTVCNIEITPDTGINYERINVHFPGRILKLELPGVSKKEGNGSLLEFREGEVVANISDGIPEIEGNGFYCETDLFLSGLLNGETHFADHDLKSCMQSVEIMNCLHHKGRCYP